MSYYEELTKTINEKAGSWKNRQDGLKKEIESQEALEKEYQKNLDDEMQKGPASVEAAQINLNLEYAKKRLKKAQEDLKELEHTPLYTLEDYDKECNKIVNAYKVEAYSYRIKLQEAISDSLDIIEKMEGLAKEADKCDKELQAACSACGQDIKTDFGNAKKKGLYRFVFPNEASGWKHSIEELDRSLKR